MRNAGMGELRRCSKRLTTQAFAGSEGLIYPHTLGMSAPSLHREPINSMITICTYISTYNSQLPSNYSM